MVRDCPHSCGMGLEQAVGTDPRAPTGNHHILFLQTMHVHIHI